MYAASKVIYSAKLQLKADLCKKIREWEHTIFMALFLVCIVLYCTVLYCTVLYCIMRPYTEGRLGPYCIGILRELAEIGTQPWLSEGSLTCDPCHHKGTIF